MPPHAGCSLLDMPMEILQAIAAQMSATEWAQGPSCTCRTLNRLTLPCISINVHSSQLTCLAYVYCLAARHLLCPMIILMSSAHWHRQNACLLQLGVLGDDIYFDTMYDREIISWAVQRMRPDFKHLRMCAAGGTLIVWEASEPLSLEECVSKGPFMHIIIITGWQPIA